MCPPCEMVWPMRVTASLPGLWNGPTMNLHEWPEPQQPPHPLQQRIPPLGLSALNEQADCDVLLSVPKMASNEYCSLAPGREENCSAAGGGGGSGTEAHLPNPPPSSGIIWCWAWPTCRARGGGSTPTSAAQNDPHVARIILTTHLWGRNFWWKKLS